MMVTGPFTTVGEFEAAFELVRGEICARLAPGKDPKRVRLNQVIMLQIAVGQRWIDVTDYRTDMVDRIKRMKAIYRLKGLV